jgi:predicted cation transporter
MNWMLIWTAITAISTSIACIIALFLPIVLHKIEHNKKLHILVDSQLCMDIANDIEEPLLTVQISNIGNIPIEIQSISLMIDKGTNSVYLTLDL